MGWGEEWLVWVKGEGLCGRGEDGGWKGIVIKGGVRRGVCRKEEEEEWEWGREVVVCGEERRVVEFLCSYETTAQCCDSSFTVTVAQLVVSVLIGTKTSRRP